MKFNKLKCAKCKYHQAYRGGQMMYCNYASLMDKTCLKMVGKDVVDSRGYDYDGCKLFEEGKALSDKKNFKY